MIQLTITQSLSLLLLVSEKKKFGGGGERERVAAMEFSIIKSVVISPHGCFIAEIWTGIYCFSVGFGTQSV